MGNFKKKQISHLKMRFFAISDPSRIITWIIFNPHAPFNVILNEIMKKHEFKRNMATGNDGLILYKKSCSSSTPMPHSMSSFKKLEKNQNPYLKRPIRAIESYRLTLNGAWGYTWKQHKKTLSPAVGSNDRAQCFLSCIWIILFFI